MLISHNWLTRLLATANPQWQVSAAELDAGFVRVGFETEGYEALEQTTGPLVIGRVLAIEELTGFKKPIRYCQVDVGQANGTGQPQGIICGARNFAEGDLVVVALPGAVLPGGFAIAERATYDHISQGMMCSAAELGFADKSEGIITLDESYGPVGQDAREVIDFADTVFDVNITPDRGYALSARGLAREIASAFELNYEDPATNPGVAGIDLAAVPAAEGELLEVDVQPNTLTRRFGLRKVSGINPAAQSPLWLQRELMLSGQRPVNAPTDITNYIMLLLGQPMHAFDAALISGPLVVRTATEGEEFETLDHVRRTLDSADVVICDDNGIQSLAGVMGGTTTEISEHTTEVYFEAANWDPMTVARTSRRHKLSSEASRRFERGVDPALVEVALDYACALLVECAGGSIAPQRTVVGELPQPEPIALPWTMPGRYAGVDYSQDTVARRLEEVGCSIVRDGEIWQVSAPTWRSDLSMDVDLVEEVLRLEGLEDIPSILPTPVGGRGLSAAQLRRRAVGHALAYQGYAEILPTPFIANDTFDIWGLDAADPRRQTVRVQNPLEADKGILATSLLPAMLEAVARNTARGRKDLALFGLKQVSFARADRSPMPSVASRPDADTIAQLIASLPHQPLHVATVAVGYADTAGPWGAGRAYDYADAIESARIVGRAAGVELEIRAADTRPWHPGRCAAIVVAGDVVGHAGELHPEIIAALGLPERTCAMEIDLSALPLTESFPAPVLSAFPALHQDIAVVVAEDTPAEQVREALAAGAGPLLESISLFDIFRGEQIGADRKSLTFELIFRAPDRTLTDDEVNVHREAAVAQAAASCGAQQRV